MPVATSIDQLNKLLPQRGAGARVRGPEFEAARWLDPALGAARGRRAGWLAARVVAADDAGEPWSAQQGVEARVAAVTAVQQSAAIVRVAYDSAGASAVRRSGVLERLLREASCLTHHISANLASYELTGRVRSGVDALHLRV